MTLRRLATFLKTESASGVVLMIAAVLALIWANSPAAPLYDAILEMKVAVTAGGVGLDKPLILWINDGLMAIFFLLVGLEIKREVLEGELSSPAKAMLPGIAALGGMAVPALVYCLFAQAEPGALQVGRSRPPPTSPSRSACWPYWATGSPAACASSCWRWRSWTIWALS